MPTLYNHSVQVDTEVEVDIELELQEIANMVEDEMGDFIAAYASCADIFEGIKSADYTTDIFKRLLGNMTGAEISEELSLFCDNHPTKGVDIMHELDTWVAPNTPQTLTEPPTLADLLTVEEVATLESARRAVSAIHSLVLVEAVMQRNYSPGNPWLDTLNNLDALLEKIDPTKKETK
jgi:hypothetical protein